MKVASADHPSSLTPLWVSPSAGPFDGAQGNRPHSLDPGFRREDDVACLIYLCKGYCHAACY